MPFIKDVLFEKNQAFIGLTETWLSDKYLEAELDIPGYSIFRSDRKREKAKRGRLSGGVCVYVRDDLASMFEPVVQFSNGVVELLVMYSKQLNLCLIMVYRQPDQVYGHRSTSIHFKPVLERISNFLSSIEGPLPNIILGGDFNLPHGDWSGGVSSRRVVGEERKMVDSLLQLSINFGLKQCIVSSTHMHGNLLDLVFINNEFLCHHSKCFDVLRTVSHHKIVEIYSILPFGSVVEKPAPLEYEGLRKFNFFDDDIDWNEINTVFDSYDWENEFAGLNIDEMTEKFLGISELVCSVHIPKKLLLNKDKKKIPRDRKILMRRRRKLNLQLNDLNISLKRKSSLRKILVQVEKDLLNSHSKSKSRAEKKAVQSIKKNKKCFFSYVNKLSKTASKIGPLVTNENTLVSDPQKMAEMLSDQFCSVYTPQSSPVFEPEEIFPRSFNGGQSPSLSDVNFDKDDIVEAIKELSPYSGAGPNGYPPVMLIKCANTLSNPLFLIYRRSLDVGKVPKCFKIGNVTPLYKSGSRGLSANYRPITLTSHLSKVFEKIIRNCMLDFFEENNLLSNNQHGFRRGRSCISQLIAHFERILDELQKGCNVDVIYLDFSKAFDKLDFNTLLTKLKRFGICDKLGRWLHSFLVGREQFVTVQGFRSFLRLVLSGVPQGSVLGPLLFIIFINDVDRDIVSSFLSSFADDTRAGLGIKNVGDAATLQEDLNRIYSWADENKMVLNASKFELLQYGKHEFISLYSYFDSNGQIIVPNEHVKDLGIFMSPTADFSHHIDSVISKVNNLTSWALRSFKCRSADFILTTWKSVILPHLDYGSQLWNPHKKGDIQRLEMVQKCFVSKIVGLTDLSYWDILKSVGLYSLQRRRERYRIIYIWCIFEGFVPNPKPQQIVARIHPRHGRSCNIPVVKQSSYQSQVYSSFAVQGAMLFNCMPKEVRDATNCEKSVFKRKLDNYLKTVPDEPQLCGYTANRRADTNSLLDMVQYSC